jgi:mannosyltransferase
MIFKNNLRMILKQKRYTLIIILILLLGISLRIFNLGKFDFWFDEAVNILQAKNIERINFLRNNNPPLFTIFLHFWSKCFDSEYGLRLISVIFGSISVFIVYVLGKMLYTKKVGLISAFILAISPFHIYYSQEVRMYSMVVLLNLVSVYFLLESTRKGSVRFWVGFVVFSVLNIYCHYIGILSWLAQAIFFFVDKRKLGPGVNKRWLISNILISLSFVPWLYFFIKGMGEIEKNLLSVGITPWGPPVSILSLFVTFKNFSAGYNAYAGVYLLTTGIFLYLFIKGVLKFWPKKELILCLLCLLIPISVAFMISPLKRFYVDRFFIGSSLFYFFIASSGLSFLRKKTLVFFLLAISLLATFSLSNYYKNIFPPSPEMYQWVVRKIEHEAIAKYIYEKVERGDCIFHTSPATVFPFIYYFSKLEGENNWLRGKNFLLTLPYGLDEPKVYELSLDLSPSDKSHVVSIEDKDRFWLVFSHWNFERIRIEYPQAFSLLEWIDESHAVTEKKEFDGAVVLLYTRIKNQDL